MSTLSVKPMVSFESGSTSSAGAHQSPRQRNMGGQVPGRLPLVGDPSGRLPSRCDRPDWSCTTSRGSAFNPGHAARTMHNPPRSSSALRNKPAPAASSRQFTGVAVQSPSADRLCSQPHGPYQRAGCALKSVLERFDPVPTDRLARAWCPHRESCFLRSQGSDQPLGSQPPHRPGRPPVADSAVSRPCS